MADIKFEILDRYGELSRSQRDWRKELNFAQWNEREPKYDIREWSPEYAKMTKGITLNREELAKLKGILGQMELDD